MKFFLASALGVAALGVLTGAASAQTMDVQKPIRVLVGGYFPKEGGDNLFSLGASYDFHKTKEEKPTVFNGYFDYASKSGVSLFGFGVGLRGMLASPMASGSPYYGVGMGVYSIDPQGGSTKSKLGGKIQLGYQLNNGWFGEVDYTFISKINGADPSGSNVRLGYRF